MNFLVRFWNSISIAKKLYAVVGIMAMLLIGELLILHFAMQTLSSVRAFVSGEALWSKAQKNAAFSLQRYAITHDEKDFEAFIDYLKVPQGDRRARIELSKPHPDYKVAREGFLQGQIHPDDIDPMIKLLRRFSSISYLSNAIGSWTEGDRLLIEFEQVGQEYREALKASKPEPKRLENMLARIRTLNQELTVVEGEFSEYLGEGSRWLERLIIVLLSIAVLTVEGIGLTLTFITSRNLGRDLENISNAASAIGSGDFTQRIHTDARDEVGRVAESVNRMGEMLQNSYRELEAKVQERTLELSRAVRSRDDFLSIASHELKTPLTSLKLRAQIRMKLLQDKTSEYFTTEKIQKMIEDDDRQISRLVRLVDDMLDISRLNRGKFVLDLAPFDLNELVKEVLERFQHHLQVVNCPIELKLADSVQVTGDFFRLEQVFTNLLTNAMKYAPQKPIHVQTVGTPEYVELIVEDQGIGVNQEDHERIFHQFERAVSAKDVSGLGLGLYIAKEIVLAHHGTISVKSTPGQGARFTVRLPRVREG